MTTVRAYLIHRFNWRDSSVIGHFLTPGGMVSAILKGARRPKSPLSPGLRPFVCLHLDCYGRSDLKTARALECGQSPPVLSYVQQACGLYANELIHALANDDSDSGVFDAYSTLMAALPVSSGKRLEWALRHFERQVLASCGYGLSLPNSHQATNCLCHYQPGKGLQLYHASKPRPDAIAYEAMARFLQGGSPESSNLNALKRLMRQCIDDAVDGKKLRARELLRPIVARDKKNS